MYLIFIVIRIFAIMIQTKCCQRLFFKRLEVLANVCHCPYVPYHWPKILEIYQIENLRNYVTLSIIVSKHQYCKPLAWNPHTTKHHKCELFSW